MTFGLEYLCSCTSPQGSITHFKHIFKHAGGGSGKLPRMAEWDHESGHGDWLTCSLALPFHEAMVTEYSKPTGRRHHHLPLALLLSEQDTENIVCSRIPTGRNMGCQTDDCIKKVDRKTTTAEECESLCHSNRALPCYGWVWSNKENGFWAEKCELMNTKNMTQWTDVKTTSGHCGMFVDWISNV